MSIHDAMDDGKRQDTRIAGVVVGVVSNNRDPDDLGRVKLTFPWRSAGDESHWARVATMMAGKGRGSYFLPEVGDEVLVAFDNGDIHHPYVVGCLWNGKDTPPANNSNGNNDLREIISRKGHTLKFDDSSGKEQLVIMSAAGNQITLDDTSGSEKVEIKDKGGNSIVFDAAQNNLTVKCSMKLSIKANMVEISADSTMKLESSGTMTIKGAIVQIN